MMIFFGSGYSSYDRHIIWKCKYLNFPIERLTRKEKKMIEKFNFEKRQKESKIKIYSEPMYSKKIHNIVEYDTQDHYIKQRIDKEEEKVEKIKRKYDVMEEFLSDEGTTEEILQEAKEIVEENIEDEEKNKTINNNEKQNKVREKKIKQSITINSKVKKQREDILKKYQNEDNDEYDYMKNQILNV